LESAPEGEAGHDGNHAPTSDDAVADFVAAVCFEAIAVLVHRLQFQYFATKRPVDKNNRVGCGFGRSGDTW
jgi:hypothetical protein